MFSFWSWTLKTALLQKNEIPHGLNSSIVLGFDGEGNVYGGVIINSRINRHIDQTVRDYHMPIKCERYTFLKYDSFVDCLCLKTAPLAKFTKGKYVGKIASDDLVLIMGTLRESPREKRINLLKFGIL